MDSSTVHDDLSVGDVFTPQADIPQRLEEKKSRMESSPARNPIANDGGPLVVPAIKNQVESRKKKKKQHRGTPKVAPALSTVRGFTPGDESSDVSTTSSRAPSFVRNGASPVIKPTSGCGVSALKSQLDSLHLSDNGGSLKAPSVCSETPSNASVCSDSDQTEVLTSYEVPLEHDFVSPDAVAAEDGTPEDTANAKALRNQLCRKMASDDFEPILCLGKGSFGTVLLVRHRLTGKLYAQKQFRKASITVHKKLVEQTKTERTILESVSRHPFVVKLFYAFQDHEMLYLILEYAQGGELFTHLAMERMFDEDVAAFYLAEMVLALEHLHQNVGVIYRDLKPENCLLDQTGHLLLTDFGLSKIVAADDDNGRCNSSLGTIEYMAPEVVQGKSYGKACDWWSLGALGYDLLTGSPPFKANNHTKLQEKILKQKLVLPYFLGPDAKDLLTRLMRKEPSKRLGYHMPKDLQTIKKHRFFRKIDWKALDRRDVSPPISPVVTDPALAENFSFDFTGLPLASEQFSSSASNSKAVPVDGMDTDPFGGFSFVASSSLLDHVR